MGFLYTFSSRLEGLRKHESSSSRDLSDLDGEFISEYGRTTHAFGSSG
jgi:hypothetical protein